MLNNNFNEVLYRKNEDWYVSPFEVVTIIQQMHYLITKTRWNINNKRFLSIADNEYGLAGHWTNCKLLKYFSSHTIVYNAVTRCYACAIVNRIHTVYVFSVTGIFLDVKDKLFYSSKMFLTFKMFIFLYGGFFF